MNPEQVIIRDKAEEISRLKGTLMSYPVKVTRAKIEEQLRLQGLMLPSEILRYEVNVEEVKNLIARLERQKRSVEQESEFAKTQLQMVKSELGKLEAVIKGLEDDLANGV